MKKTDRLLPVVTIVILVSLKNISENKFLTF
nr:MAG TPA: hypothetical protein [Bacteriophage sp.]